MGETIATMKVSSLKNRKSVQVEVLVDTGATYSAIPEAVLHNLGVTVMDSVTIELADGRAIERNLGAVMVEVEGKVRPTPVLFGKEGDAAIMGLVSLEACGLAVDPVHRKLVPLQKIHRGKGFVFLGNGHRLQNNLVAPLINIKVSPSA